MTQASGGREPPGGTKRPHCSNMVCAPVRTLCVGASETRVPTSRLTPAARQSNVGRCFHLECLRPVYFAPHRGLQFCDPIWRNLRPLNKHDAKTVAVQLLEPGVRDARIR